MDDELWDVILDDYNLRELQREAARAISTMKADNDTYINLINKHIITVSYGIEQLLFITVKNTVGFLVR